MFEWYTILTNLALLFFKYASTKQVTLIIMITLTSPWIILILGLPLFIMWHRYVFINTNPWRWYLSKIPFPKWLHMWNEWIESDSVYNHGLKVNQVNSDYFYEHAIAYTFISAVISLLIPIIPIIILYAVIPAVILYLLIMKLPRTLIILTRKVSLLFKHINKEEPKY